MSKLGLAGNEDMPALFGNPGQAKRKGVDLQVHERKSQGWLLEIHVKAGQISVVLLHAFSLDLKDAFGSR